MQQQIFLVLAMLAMMTNTTTTHVPFDGRPIDQFETPSRYFDETGHNVWGPFLAFYEAHGGANAFGLPITDRLYEAGREVQYFEHARFEFHPDQAEPVRLSHLGRLLIEDRLDEPAFAPHEPGPTTASIYVPETGHNISHHFRDFWLHQGGVERFGYPISEAFIDQNHPAGKPFMVQYFERARLEYALAYPGAPPQLRMAMLGREYALKHRLPTQVLTASRPVVQLSTSVMSFSPSSAELHNATLAAQAFDGLRVMPGEQVSFLNTLGEISSNTGYVPGTAIVGNGIGLEMGGGICYVSTILYRGVLAAGLENIERHQHTLALADFNDIPGLDSAVYTYSADGVNRSSEDLDLRWRNDMADPIMVTTDIASTGVLTVTIWGYDDGRITELRDPTYITQDIPSGPPIWLSDASMPVCEIRHLQGNPGMQVQRERVVWDANGSQLSTDPIISDYAGSRDVFLYGPGIDLAVAQYRSPEKAQQLCRQAQHAANKAPRTAPLPEEQSQPATENAPQQQGTVMDQMRQVIEPAQEEQTPPQEQQAPHNDGMVDQLHSIVEQRGEILVEEPGTE